jgi:hypothetical protein
MVSCSACPLTTLIIWAAVLLYDYCLTFVAEVERCWAVRRLSWGLGFFYLNRYLVLFSHIPLMMEYFWTTSNSNKTEVSIMLLKISSLRPGGKILMRSLRQMLVFIHLWHSKMAIDLIISLVQLSSLGNVSDIHNLHYSGGRCL